MTTITNGSFDGSLQSYVLIAKSQRCSVCNWTQRWSEVYLRSNIPPVWHKGQPVQDLKRVFKCEWNLPIERKKQHLPDAALCTRCFEPSVAHLPSPPEPKTPTAVAIAPDWAGQGPTKDAKPPAKPASRTLPKDPAALLGLL